MELQRQIREKFGIEGCLCGDVIPSVADVLPVAGLDGRFALKIYSPTRLPRDVRWEVELVRHLAASGVPVAKPMESRHSGVEILTVNGRERPAVLFEWAPGAKPSPSAEVYALLGKAAAQLHAAADTFAHPSLREVYDAACLIDSQLELMKDRLREAGRWTEARALGERLHRLIDSAALDRGICHMDLTLDNVHVDGETIIVFDFDSAGECWRSLEPHSALRSSVDHFHAWLDGYRSVRAFSEEDERAARAFSIIADLRGVAWKLGVAASSRGAVMNLDDLSKTVDAWLAWDL